MGARLEFGKDDWVRLLGVAYKAEERFAEKWCSMTSHLSRHSIEWRQLVAQHADILRSRHAQSTAVMAVSNPDDQ
jgi:hypothetical protein